MPLRPNSEGRPPLPKDRVRHLASEGTLRLPDGQRTAVLGGAFLPTMLGELTGALGDQPRQNVYKVGYEWALQDMVRLSRQLSAEFGGGANLDLWQMDLKFVLERWWTPLQAAGWGAWRLDLSSLARGLAFLELRASVIASHAGVVTQPACHLYAGLFAGAFSFFDRIERHAGEFQCAALGAPTCKFVVGPAAQVDEVETWRQQQVSADEIRRRLA